jgi:formyl-CoA transferase
LGRPEWLGDPEWNSFAGRARNRVAINAAIAERTATNGSDFWLARLEEAGIPAGPINRVDQVFADPQVRHLGIAQEVVHPRLGRQAMVGSAIGMSGVDARIRTPTPDAGQDTDEVLASLGYDAEARAALRAARVV